MEGFPKNIRNETKISTVCTLIQYSAKCLYYLHIMIKITQFYIKRKK